MKRLGIAMAATAVTIAAPAAAQDAAGTWVGILEVTPQARLPLVLHVERGEDGAWSGTLDSPAQGAAGLELSELTAAAGKLAFAVPSVGGHYSGTWDEGSASWKGEWSQGSTPLPLAFGRPPKAAPLPAGWQLPSNAEIAATIADRNAPRAGQGIVVGVLGPDDRRIVAGGPAEGQAFDGETEFEIGSITKVFTALILADMANEGEVSLDDPAQKYLPAGHTMPTRNGRQITLRDLSTHTSGLPRLPDNMPFGDPADPYADYTEALLLAFLDGYQLPHDVGAKWEYSNLGVGLLGYLLARAAGTDYDTVLRERITGPLGMDDTAIALSADEQARLAQPLDEFMRPVKPWHLPLFKGAGAIRSTVTDMLKFAAAALDPSSPIGSAMKTALSVRVPTGTAKVEQALGWQVYQPEPGREVLTHDGGTGGFRSSLALEPGAGRAAVVLANSAAEPSAGDLALHALIGSPVAPTPPVPPAPPPPPERTAITLSPAELDRVVGRYDFGNGVKFAVTRAGGQLSAQRQGSLAGPVLPIYPETPLAFFWKGADIAIRFTADADGKVVGAEFRQGAATLTGKRVEP